MAEVKYLITKDSVHLSFEGQYHSVTVHDGNYGEVRTLIKEGRQDEIADILRRKALPVAEYIEGSGLSMVNGRLQDSAGNVLPQVLNDRLKALKEDGFPVDSLVNFWRNLNTNPSEASRNQLFAFLEQNGHPLTEDGHFVAYRGVRADFKDKHTGTFDNSVGAVCEMPREDVDDNPNQTCSRGLHVAAYGYASGFSSTLVEVKVNPRDVVAVPNDYNGQKMRVCRFEVMALCAGEIKATVYGTDYVSWEDDTEEVDEEHEAELEDQRDTIVDLACDHKDRYKDRAMLASRIEEALDDDYSYNWDADKPDMEFILETLNDRQDDWED
jgi:hypothetical protein